MRPRWIAASVGVWLAAMAAAQGQKPLAPSAIRSHPSIRYQDTAPRDPVASLDARLQRGDARLQWEPGTGYLKSVLAALQVPVDSQLLVFSKTSFQASLINPGNPRALYFNDTVSVGWVRGGPVLEFVGQDPTQGAVFYTLEQNPDAAPRFTRDMSCVQCHTWEATGDVPGMFLGSGFPSANGTLLYAPVYSTDHRTPFDIRWGGWYVTGEHALRRHLGNALVTGGVTIDTMVTPNTLRTTSLEGRFDTAAYPSPHSDIVALLTLEHQARMLNLITRAGWEARIGPAIGRPISEVVEELVDYMLFVDEQPLPGPVTGSSTFSRTFPAGGPRDGQGRSLREFDLRTRLMRYPCSFLIYSEPFNALPEDLKRAIYARLWDVLSGRVAGPRYATLSATDRENVLAILRDTKPDLPDYFSEAVASTP
jgi:hypothetical protein